MDEPRKTYWIGEYAALALIFLVIHYVLVLPLFEPWAHYVPVLRKLTMSLVLIMAILVLGKIIERMIDRSVEAPGNRYNLVRITRLLTVIFMLIVAASFLFQNLYAAAVSFGLISLVLGFALQAPITSFIAWLYIIFRKPYQVGDRIQIAGFKGDVTEVNYLDTVILEFSGIYLENDRRSGRVVTIPNSMLLKSDVVNYSGPLAPFIWNETALPIAYTSDLQFVEECLMDAATADLKERFPELDPELPEYKAAVYFRNNSYAWLEAVVSYPVEPEDTTGRRNRILRRALPALNQRPELVRFPEGVLR